MKKENKSLNKRANKDNKNSQQLFDNQIWMNSKEAAFYLRISENNLRAKVSRGQIQVDGYLGRTMRFRRDELDTLLKDSQPGDFND